MKFLFSGFILFCLSLIISSCRTYQVSDYSANKFSMKADYPVDSAMWKFLIPFRDSLNKTMQVVIGKSDSVLTKQQPEGTLGNFVADALLIQSRKELNSEIDFSIVNNGGIRIPSLPAGEITMGKIFELMPFDNSIALIEANGKIVHQLINKAAAKGGWPVAGMQYMIYKGTAEQIYINGKKLDTLANYHFVCSDYIANGGDDCTFLISEKKIMSPILFRNLLINYILSLTAEGKSISEKLEQRVVNE